MSVLHIPLGRRVLVIDLRRHARRRPPTAHPPRAAHSARLWWAWSLLLTGVGAIVWASGTGDLTSLQEISRSGLPGRLEGLFEPSSAASRGALATLEIEGVPSGTVVEIDGKVRGAAPTHIPIPAGAHTVRLRRTGFIGARYQIHASLDQVVTLRPVLWPEAPTVRQVRSPVPGATIARASFLADGRLALTVTLPGLLGTEYQAWVDPTSAAISPPLLSGGRAPAQEDERLHRVGPPESWGPLAVAPDGERVAYLVRSRRSTMPVAAFPIGPGEGRFDEVWLSPGQGVHGALLYRLAPNQSADNRSTPAALPGWSESEKEQLVDIAWAPDGAYLLVVARRPLSGGVRTRLLWLELGLNSAQAEGVAATRELAVIPADLVPGSYAWSRAGDRLAFGVRTATGTTTWMLRLPDGTDRSPDLRYVADSSPSDGNAPGIATGSTWPPFVPLAWSPDGGRVVYAGLIDATPKRPAGVSLLPGASGRTMGLFLADTSQPLGAIGQESARLGEASGQSPLWRSDGVVVVLAQPKQDGPLSLRAVDRDGRVTELVTLKGLPVPAGAGYAALWDDRQTQVLVALRRPAASGSHLQYWLVRFGTPPDIDVREAAAAPEPLTSPHPDRSGSGEGAGR